MTDMATKPRPERKTAWKSAWKTYVMRLQGRRCILCGLHLPRRQGTWDHFVPRSITGIENRPLNIGLVFFAHGDCNGARGDASPDESVKERVADVIKLLDGGWRLAAIDNVRRVHAACLASMDANKSLKALPLLEFLMASFGAD